MLTMFIRPGCIDFITERTSFRAIGQAFFLRYYLFFFFFFFISLDEGVLPFLFRNENLGACHTLMYFKLEFFVFLFGFLVRIQNSDSEIFISVNLSNNIIRVPSFTKKGSFPNWFGEILC